VKLVLQFAHEHRPGTPEISTALSLAVIGVILAAATIASIAATRRDPRLRARAGSLRSHRSREPRQET
jgi:tellurite resistance protein TerC